MEQREQLGTTQIEVQQQEQAQWQAKGLYNSAYEKDACGMGFVVDIKGRKSHDIIDDGLRILERLEHRGARGADASSGDGAGILVQIPHNFFSGNVKYWDFRCHPLVVMV